MNKWSGGGEVGESHSHGDVDGDWYVVVDLEVSSAA